MLAGSATTACATQHTAPERAAIPSDLCHCPPRTVEHPAHHAQQAWIVVNLHTTSSKAGSAQNNTSQHGTSVRPRSAAGSTCRVEWSSLVQVGVLAPCSTQQPVSCRRTSMLKAE